MLQATKVLDRSPKQGTVEERQTADELERRELFLARANLGVLRTAKASRADKHRLLRPLPTRLALHCWSRSVFLSLCALSPLRPPLPRALTLRPPTDLADLAHDLGLDDSAEHARPPLQPASFSTTIATSFVASTVVLQRPASSVVERTPTQRGDGTPLRSPSSARNRLAHNVDATSQTSSAE